MFEIEKVAKLKMAELEEVLKAYEVAGIKMPEEAFANNAERIKFIELTYEDVGMVITVEEEDLENEAYNLAEGVEIGDVVIVGKPVVDPNAAKEEEDEKDENKNKGQEDEDSDESDGDVGEEEVSEAIDSGKVRYDGRLIVGTRPVVAHGKLYRELDGGDCRFQCTQEEFNKLIRAALGK